MRSQIWMASGSATPDSRRAFIQTPRWRRQVTLRKSCWPEVTPRMTLARSRFISVNWFFIASSRTWRAAMRARSWQVSVAEMAVGWTPNSMGSKSISPRNDPRRQ